MADSNGAPWETSDLGTAAYIHGIGGLEILGAQRRGAQRGGQFVFMFKDPDQKGTVLQVEYLNSDCRKFDAAVRSLKKLCYDEPRVRARRR